MHWLTDDEGVRAYLEGIGLEKDETVTGGLILGWPDTEDGLPQRAPLPRTGNPVVWVE